MNILFEFRSMMFLLKIFPELECQAWLFKSKESNRYVKCGPSLTLNFLGFGTVF